MALALVTLGAAFAATSKRGTSGLAGCKDASSLNLGNTWDYNWGLMPFPGGSGEPGSPTCDPPRTAEFVPMVRTKLHIVTVIRDLVRETCLQCKSLYLENALHLVGF